MRALSSWAIRGYERLLKRVCSVARWLDKKPLAFDNLTTVLAGRLKCSTWLQRHPEFGRVLGGSQLVAQADGPYWSRKKQIT